MNQDILTHYSQFGLFSNPGNYADYLKTLPKNVRVLGNIVRWSTIHRTTLEWGNTDSNADLKFGDMNDVPWYRQAEDDTLTTSSSMIAELFRRDERGITMERKVEDKIVVTCRYVALLMATLLKSQGIPARVRSGFAGYWEGSVVSDDHWITEYWNQEEGRWVAIDIDGSYHDVGFDLYDMPKGKYEYSAEVWLDVRRGTKKGEKFLNASGHTGLVVIAWELFYDFHCLMNSEILYTHHPEFVTLTKFKKCTEEKLQELDHFAELMINPDENFAELKKIWETNK